MSPQDDNAIDLLAVKWRAAEETPTLPHDVLPQLVDGTFEEDGPKQAEKVVHQ